MHFIPEIQIYTLLGLKKFQVLCYCNTSCVLQSAKLVYFLMTHFKHYFYLVTSSVENFQTDSSCFKDPSYSCWTNWILGLSLEAKGDCMSKTWSFLNESNWSTYDLNITALI